MSEREREGEGYHGWANYPTWATFTWLTSEEARQEGVLDVIAHAEDPTAAAMALRDWVTPTDQLPAGEPGLFTGLLGWALQAVDWGEVARALGPDAWRETGGEGV